MDLAAASGAVSSLKAAFDLTKAILDVAGATKIRGQIIELQSQIIAAQSSAMEAQTAQAALIARVRELEAQLAKREDWTTEKERYELRQIVPGNFAYVLKGAVSGPQAVQSFCQNCFEQERKSPLNLLQLGDTKLYQCKACNAQFSNA